MFIKRFLHFNHIVKKIVKKDVGMNTVNDNEEFKTKDLFVGLNTRRTNTEPQVAIFLSLFSLTLIRPLLF